MSFKQEVVVALLQNLEWMPKFDSMEDAAEYLNQEPPENTGGAIALQQQVIATLVAETAEHIVRAVGD